MYFQYICWSGFQGKRPDICVLIVVDQKKRGDEAYMTHEEPNCNGDEVKPQNLCRSHTKGGKGYVLGVFSFVKGFIRK